MARIQGMRGRCRVRLRHGFPEGPEGAEPSEAQTPACLPATTCKTLSTRGQAKGGGPIEAGIIAWRSVKEESMVLKVQPLRRALVFLVLVFLSFPVLGASAVSGRRAEPGQGALVWLSLILQTGPSKARCVVDSKGKGACPPPAGAPSVTPKHGCGIDPNGIFLCTP